METPEAPIPMPEFIVTSHDAELKASLEKFGQELTSTPEKFLPIVYSVGNMALAGADLSYEIDGDIAGHVRHYFMHGHDLDVDFDTATEDALRQDETQAKLINARNEARRNNETERAGELMAQIQHNRLAFFVGRLIKARADQPKDLRKTG